MFLHLAGPHLSAYIHMSRRLDCLASILGQEFDAGSESREMQDTTCQFAIVLRENSDLNKARFHLRIKFYFPVVGIELKPPASSATLCSNTVI